VSREGRGRRGRLGVKEGGKEDRRNVGRKKGSSGEWEEDLDLVAALLPDEAASSLSPRSLCMHHMAGIWPRSFLPLTLPPSPTLTWSEATDR